MMHGASGSTGVLTSRVSNEVRAMVIWRAEVEKMTYSEWIKRVLEKELGLRASDGEGCLESG